MAGNFLILDSKDGKELLKTQTGGSVAGGVISYQLGGTQYVAVTSGNVSRLTFSVSTGAPSLIIYALGGSKAAAASPAAATTTAVAAGSADNGKGLYAKNCAACHGAGGEGGVGPSLKGISERRDLEQTINWIKNPSAKMPKLYPTPLGDQAVADIAAYVRKF
jgi:mono/diheme cytochrome c family protein